MRIRLRIALMLMLLSPVARGAWAISYFETTAGEKTGDVRVHFRLNGEDEFASFEGVMDELENRSEVQHLTSISLSILNDEKWNARLVEELRKRKPRELMQAAERNLSAGWDNPDINALRGELKGAVLALKPFQKIEAELNALGLSVRNVTTEKFWVGKKEGKLRILGMGLWISVKPLSFGMESRKDERRVGLYLNHLLKEDGKWVGVFQFYAPKDESLRVYGRWSAKDKMYVLGKARIGWLIEDEWKSEAEPVVNQGEASFRVSKETSHKVRISLGRIDRGKAVVRIRGPRFSAFSEEFVLSERAEEFIQLE